MPAISTLVLVVSFLAVLLLVEGLRGLSRDVFGMRGAMNKRVRMLAQGVDGAEVLATLRRKNNADQHGLYARLLAWPPVARLDGLLGRAGLTIPTGQYLGRMAACTGVILLVAAVVVRLALWKALLLAAILGVLLPLCWLHLRARRRLYRLSLQLPDAIDMLVRSLRAGHPIASAIGLVAREMPDPIGSEFGLVFDEMTYGLDLKEALENLAQRLPVRDLHFLVVAVRVQYGTGGNLAEVLAGLGRVIRDRIRMKSRIRALSAEGRLSATVLSALPFVLGGVIFAMRPDYYLKAMGDPAFLPLVSVGLFGIALGIVAMQRIVNFRF